MSRDQALALITFIYAGVVLGIAVWAHRRTHHANDYLVASRRGTTAFVALSQCLNLLPAWLMMSLCASAFVWGLSATWLAVGLWLGALLQTYFIAPRARTLSAGQHSVTLLQMLSCESGERLQRNIVRCASLLVSLATCVIVLIQLQVLAQLLAPTTITGLFGLTLVGAFLIVVGTAGWWAYAAMEAVHAIAMLLVVLFTAVLAHSIIGNWHDIRFAMQSMPPEYLQWDGGRKLVITIASIGGALGLAGLPLGQPALLSRAIAARDEKVARASGIVIMVWATLMLAGLLAIGWLGRVLYFGLQDTDFALLEISRRTLHPALAALITLLVSGALLTNVIAQLGVLSLVCVNDLRPRKVQLHPEWARVWVIVITIAMLVLLRTARVFEFGDLLFCWTAVGATLAPLLVVRLAGKRVRAGSTIGAMSAGFVLVCIFHLMPDAPGDFLERVLPFVAGIGIALSGGERRRNPDRADRSEETVHDRLPI